MKLEKSNRLQILKKNNKQKYQNIKNVKPIDFRLIQSSNDESINKQLTELIKKIFKKMYEFKNIHELTNKDLKMIISFLKDNKNMAEDFINIIDKLLNEMYNYLYFSDYKTYIIKKFKTNKFKVVNDEGYVTDTYNTTIESTPYVYFKISKEGQIEEYNGNIIEDEDFSIFKIGENKNNDLIVLYRYVVKNFTVIKFTLMDYNNIIKKSTDFGGLNIKYFFENLFFMNENEQLFINKSYGNLINQIIYAGKFKEFLEFINIISEERKEEKTYEKFERNIDYFIYNKHYDYLYNRILEDYSLNINIDEAYIYNLIDKLKLRELEKNIVKNKIKKSKEEHEKKEIKEENIKKDNISVLMSGIKFILNKINFIDDYLITIYNSSILLNFKEKFKSIESNDKKLELVSSLLNIIKLSIRDKNKIESIIKINLLFMCLPIYMFGFKKDDINSLLIYYMSILLSQGSFYSINKKFVFDKLFDKSYTINKIDPLYNVNKLSQCYVSYTNNNGDVIKHSSCGETVLLNILQKILYDNDNNLFEDKLDREKLKQFINPNTIIYKELINFFEKHDSFMKLNNKDSCIEFTRIITNIKDIEYLKSINNYNYDLKPTFENITRLLIYILTGNNEQKNIEEYKSIYTQYFPLVTYNKINDEVKLSINNMDCTFSERHAYIGIENDTINHVINDTVNLYFTLYIKKYFNEVYSIIYKSFNNNVNEIEKFNNNNKEIEKFNNNIKKFFYYLNLNLFDLYDLFPDINIMTDKLKKEIGKGIIDNYLYYKYNWLIDEYYIIFKAKKFNHIDNIKYDTDIFGINYSMHIISEIEIDILYDKFEINNIYLFITCLFNKFNIYSNFYKFDIYLTDVLNLKVKFEETGIKYAEEYEEKNIYQFIFDNMMKYEPKNDQEKLPFSMIANTIEYNDEAKRNKDVYDKLKNIVDVNEIKDLDSYFNKKFNEYTYMIKINNSRIQQVLDKMSIYSISRILKSALLKHNYIKNSYDIILNEYNIIDHYIKFTTDKPLSLPEPENNYIYILYDYQKIEQINTKTVESGGNYDISYSKINTAKYYKKYIKYKLKYLTAKKYS